MSGPKRLIEVDLPIREISTHARREKSIRHGHISTLHIWWARRPLAACRAVVLAALVPDPADPACPAAFRTQALQALRTFRDKAGGPPVPNGPEDLREAILAFIARFAAWEASTDVAFLECARALVAAAHPDGPPLVVDPFAGGGAIPLEALRVGADTWAGDYNPVAALLLKVVLEDIPRYGEELADAVRTWGKWVKDRVQADIGRFYVPDPDGAVPIAYLWARTVTCEGPGCGAEIPLIRQLWLSKKAGRHRALRMNVEPPSKRVEFEVVDDPDRVQNGTVKRGSATCPVCHYVTPVQRVRAQARDNGGLPLRMIAVVRTYPGQQGRHYRVVEDGDLVLAHEAEDELRRREKEHEGPLSLVPDEPFPAHDSRAFTPGGYGVRTWGDLFLPRQALALTAFAAAVRAAYDEIARAINDPAFARAIASSLAVCVDRAAENLSSLCRWNSSGEKVQGTFGRQAIPMVWDCAEVQPFGGSVGDWDSLLENWFVAFESAVHADQAGQAFRCDARDLPLPDDSVPCVFTDPPYYDAVPYADLSDFFFVWLRRSAGSFHPDLLGEHLTEKPGEIVVNLSTPVDGGKKDSSFFETEMGRALAEARRVLTPDGIAVVVFAHKSTGGWEVMLKALIEAGWTVTGSWPLDTEMATRLRARDSAALASSVHIVCRPQSPKAGAGDWRTVQAELEARVRDWLPRLSKEGIEGADAIFACLGPALEVYSRYSRVETAAGDPVPLSAPGGDPAAPAFLPAVWGAVAQEALSMIFEGGEAQGFEEDARLTALWLWTLRSAINEDKAKGEEEEELEDEGEGAAKPKKLKGLVLDYDTARKIAQPLGAHLDSLGKPGGIVEVRKGVARLVPVAERRRDLLGDGERHRRQGGTLFESGSEHALSGVSPGETTLDRLHQSMLLFADGHGDGLRRLLAEPGYIVDPRFRRLANALSRLYPASSAEKRWVDGVLASGRQVRR